MTTLPALTNDREKVLAHIQAGNRAAHRFVSSTVSTALVRPIQLQDGELVVPGEVLDIGDVDDDGNVTGTIWSFDPLPAAGPASAYVLLGENDEFGADPQGRWA